MFLLVVRLLVPARASPLAVVVVVLLVLVLLELFELSELVEPVVKKARSKLVCGIFDGGYV